MVELNVVEQHFKSWRRQLQDMATQIRQASDQDTLVKITTAQVREKIACVRALIYRFNSDDYGVVLAESKTVGWTPASREKLTAIIFGLAASRDYLAEEFVAIEDTNKIEITPYQLQLLDKFQIKASLSIPILLKGEIWGLLVVQMQRQSREVALTAERDRAVAKIIDKIRQSPDIEAIFTTSTFLSAIATQHRPCSRLSLQPRLEW